MTRWVAVAGVLMCLCAAIPAAAAPLCEQPPDYGRCERWLAPYNGATGVQRGEAVALSPDGSTVYVTGPSGADVATVAYETTTGAQRWVSRYTPGTSTATEIAVSADGAMVYAAGTVDGDYLVLAYDSASGQLAWEARYAGPAGTDTLNGIAVTASAVVVTGYSSGGSHAATGIDQYDFATVAFDPTDGDRLWVSRYDGPANFWDVATAVTVGRVGGREVAVVTGRSNGQSTSNDHTDYATVAYDVADGRQLWVARYDSGSRDYPYAAAVAGDAVIVTGEAAPAGSALDYVTVAYDLLDGTQRWRQRYDGAGFDDRPLAVAATPDGSRAFVTGFSANQSVPVDRDAATVAYDVASGSQVWVARKKDPAGAAASSLVVAPDGETLYVAGLRGGLVFGVGANELGVAAAYAGFLLVAYDTDNGAALWAGGYGGAGNEDAAFAVATAPNSESVYVTGGGSRFVTLAYDG